MTYWANTKDHKAPRKWYTRALSGSAWPERDHWAVEDDSGERAITVKTEVVADTVANLLNMAYSAGADAKGQEYREWLATVLDTAIAGIDVDIEHCGSCGAATPNGNDLCDVCIDRQHGAIDRDATHNGGFTDAYWRYRADPTYDLDSALRDGLADREYRVIIAED